MSTITVDPPIPTFEDLRKMFQETRETLREVSQLFKETALQSKETDRLFKETALQSKETDRQFKETDKKIQSLNQRMGDNANRLGEFVQEMVHPAVVKLFQERNLPVHQVHPNIVAYDDNRRFVMEIDLLVVNTDTAIAVECKSKLVQADVVEHLERLAIFKQHFPQYSSCKLLGAVAAMVMAPDVGRYAYRNGLFVLAQSGDAVEIRNDDRFKPMVW